MMSTRLDPRVLRDRLANVSDSRASRAAMSALDQLQDYEPQEQVTGLATLFLAVCSHYGLDPREALTVADNVMNRETNEKRRRRSFEAVKMYVENELP